MTETKYPYAIQYREWQYEHVLTDGSTRWDDRHSEQYARDFGSSKLGTGNIRSRVVTAIVAGPQTMPRVSALAPWFEETVNKNSEDGFWWWLDYRGWHGPLSEESARESNKKFGIGAPIASTSSADIKPEHAPAQNGAAPA